VIGDWGKYLQLQSHAEEDDGMMNLDEIHHPIISHYPNTPNHQSPSRHFLDKPHRFIDNKSTLQPHTQSVTV
jgi:hypothetical protein